jgi:hypothetical protein
MVQSWSRNVQKFDLRSSPCGRLDNLGKQGAWGSTYQVWAEGGAAPYLLARAAVELAHLFATREWCPPSLHHYGILVVSILASI